MSGQSLSQLVSPHRQMSATAEPAGPLPSLIMCDDPTVTRSCGKYVRQYYRRRQMHQHTPTKAHHLPLVPRSPSFTLIPLWAAASSHISIKSCPSTVFCQFLLKCCVSRNSKENMKNENNWNDPHSFSHHLVQDLRLLKVPLHLISPPFVVSTTWGKLQYEKRVSETVSDPFTVRKCVWGMCLTYSANRLLTLTS